MKTAQYTVTFPRNKLHVKEELVRMKKEESLNISAFILYCVEKELSNAKRWRK